jgi:signal transduction histidine kinase
MVVLRALRTLAAAAGACFCLALSGWSSSASAADEQVIERARFLLADDEMPPAESRAWSEVRLPDNWSTSRRLAQGIGWYRMSLDLGSSAPGRLGIFVRRLSMNGEFFVNGVRVLSGGRMADPVTRNWNTPFFVEVPAPLLRPGTNTLDIRLFAYRNNNGGLGRVSWGEAAQLQEEHASLYALHVKGAVMSFAMALVAAFIGIATWVRMKHDAAYGLFGLAMIAWSVRYANYFVHDVPFDPLAYSVAVNSAQGWFFIFFTPFLLRLSGIRWPYLERALLAMGCLGTVGIYMAYQGWVSLSVVIGFWLSIWFPGSVVLLWVSARHAYRRRSVLAILAAVVAWLYVPLTVRELLITSGRVSFDASYIAHYVSAPLALLISWMLIDRLVSAAQAKVKTELERARAAFDERQRITQDMHDGLGLQLNAALRVVERGEIDRDKVTHLLSACLDELRLIVDSSAAAASKFLPLLASLRIRLQGKLEAIGIHIHWNMDQFPQDLVLPPGMALQVLRIVQEAINNTIKHACASQIEFRVAASSHPGHIVLEVQDNGVGFATDAEQTGRGLTGMRRRATAAGVGLCVFSGNQGTTIQIKLPNLRDTVRA